MVRAWMLQGPHPLDNECCHGLGMDALGIGCIRTLMLLCFGHGCYPNQLPWNMELIVVWARKLVKSNALEKKRYHGLGMDALRTWA